MATKITDISEFNYMQIYESLDNIPMLAKAFGEDKGKELEQLWLKICRLSAEYLRLRLERVYSDVVLFGRYNDLRTQTHDSLIDNVNQYIDHYSGLTQDSNIDEIRTTVSGLSRRAFGDLCCCIACFKAIDAK